MPQDNSMPLIDLTLRHSQTLEEARRRLEIAVNEVNTRFASMIRRTEWAVDRSRVKVEGAGFWLEMSVDAQSLHATGDSCRREPAILDSDVQMAKAASR